MLKSSSFAKTFRRELQLWLRVMREPAVHLLPYELALTWNARQPAATKVPVPTSGGAKEMMSFSAAVFNQQIEGLLAAEDAGRAGDMVRLGDSTIPEAGEGVFASKTLLPGQAVALYPGTLYAPRGHWGGQGQSPRSAQSFGGFGDSSDLAEDEDDPAFSRPPADSVFVMARPGGFRIDGSPVADGSGLSKLLSKRTVHAVGHKAQHPPRPQVEPNVVEVPIAYLLCLRAAEEGEEMTRKAEEEEKRKNERKKLIRSSFLFSPSAAEVTAASSKVAKQPGTTGSSGSEGAAERALFSDEGRPKAANPTAHVFSDRQFPFDGVRVDWHQRHRIPHWFAPFNGPDSTPVPQQLFTDAHFQRHLNYVAVGKRFGSTVSSIVVGNGGTAPPSLEPSSSSEPSALGRLFDEQRRQGLSVPPFIVVPSVALIACRTIDPGEELFLDYGFSGEVPSWYKEVPVDTVKRILKRAKEARVAAENEAAVVARRLAK